MATTPLLHLPPIFKWLYDEPSRLLLAQLMNDLACFNFVALRDIGFRL